MLSPSEVGWDIGLYSQEWLDERFRLTRKLAADVVADPTPGVVHDLRVACRRLREAIDFFRGVPAVPPLSDVERAARRMARSVARLRETDVAIRTLRSFDMATGDEAADVQKDMIATLREKRERLAKKRGRRIAKRASQLGSAIALHLPLRSRTRAADVDPSGEATLRAFAETRASERRIEVERLFDSARRRGGRFSLEANLEALHAVRVAIKHWRYASEISRAVVPRVLYRPMVVKLRGLQDLGGKSQDLTDLAGVIERSLSKKRHVSRAERSFLASVRKARATTSRAFYEALKVSLTTG